MRRVSLRATKRVVRAFAWQSLGFAVVFVLLAAGIYRVETTRERITVIERVEPIDLLRECLRTPKCRALIRDTVRRASQPNRSERTERGDASQPAPAAGQRPTPPRGGGRDTDGGRGPTDRPSRPDAPSAPDQSPPPVQAPPLPVAPPPTSSPPPSVSPPGPEHVCELPLPSLPILC